MYKRCLILGGKGFIGSHLVEAMLLAGVSVRVFDRVGAESLIPARLSHLIELFEGDFADSAVLASALEGCDICFHLVSTTIPKTSNDAPGYDVQSNLLGTIKLLELVHKAGLKKIIFLSSGGTVYGIPKYLPINELHPTDPICSYGITKLAIEKYLELFRSLHGIEYTVLRVSNPYGERQRLTASQGAVAVFLARALKNEQITIWGDGSIARDYIYIGDLISSVMAVMNYSGKEHIFNIGSGVPTTLLKLTALIELILDKKLDIDFKPARLADVPINVLDIKRAQKELEWSPTVCLADGLVFVKNWITSNVNLS